MGERLYIDLEKVEASLREVQKNFDRINRKLDMRREPMREEILVNLLSGYAYVNILLARDVDLLKRPGFHHFLELNHIVLCGTTPEKRRDYKEHIQSTTDRFYQQQEFSISTLRKWAAKHQSDSPWKQASGAYILQVSWPQLFAEGNHRTGALLMSTILVRMGKPPFVLSIDNAKGYFDPSSLAKSTRKNVYGRLYKLPKIKKKFARFLEGHTQADFLVAR
jgi:hypothetical protein